MPTSKYSNLKFVFPCVAVLLASLPRLASAVPFAYWDNNGSSTPSGGTWDNSSADWVPYYDNTNPTNTAAAFTSGAFANFSAGTNPVSTLTVTVAASTTVVMSGITTEPSATISGTNVNTGANVTNITFVMGDANSAISTGSANTVFGFYGVPGSIMTFAVPIVGSGGVEIENDTTVVLQATNTPGYAFYVTPGSTLVVGEGGTVSSSSTYGGTIYTSGTLIFSNNVRSLNLTGHITNYIGGPGNVIFENAAQLNSGTAPTGTINFLEGVTTTSNRYTGTTTILDSYVTFTNIAAFFGAPNTLVTNELTLAQPLDGSVYGLRLQSGNVTLPSSFGIYVGTNLTVNATNGIGGGAINVQGNETLTIDGPITGPGSFSAGCNGALGNGLIILGAVNNYTGGTYITDGSIRLGAGTGYLPTGSPVTMYFPASAGPTININGNTQIIGPLQSMVNVGTPYASTTVPILNIGTSAGSLTVLETNVSTTFAGIIGGAGSFNVNTAAGGTPGTLTLTNVSTNNGPVSVLGATLALSGAGTFTAITSLTIAAGGTFDVSAVTGAAYTLPTTATLTASGAGTAAGSTAATINGPSGGTVSLGTQPVSLNFTPASFTGDSTHPALYLPQGTLVLSGNIISVANMGASPLGAGTYVLISAPSITGAPTTNAVVSGSGIAAGATASISVSGGNVVLTVASSTPPPTSPTITGVSISGSTLTIKATNGTPNGPYVILESTNVATPTSQWTPIATNNFDASGNVNVSTNVVSSTNQVEFYILQNP